MVLQWVVLFLMARTVVHGQGGLNFECLPAQEVRLWTTGGLLISIPGCVGKQNMASPVTITFSDCSNMEMEQQFTVWAHKYPDFYSGSEAQSVGVTCALNRSEIDVKLGSTSYLRTNYPDVTPVGVVSPTVELVIKSTDDCSGYQELTPSVAPGESYNLCLRMTADYAMHYGTRFLKVVVYIEGSGIERTLTDQRCSKGLIAASDWPEQIMMAHGTSGKLLAAKIPFNVFLLVGVDPKIFPMKLGFRVTAERCYGECGNVTCPPPSNRKRRSADELDEDFEPETVTTSLTVNMNRATQADDDINGATDGDQNEQKNGPADDVCINKGGFYGLLTFMAVSLLIAVFSSAFMFMRARKSRMPLDERDSYYREKNCSHNPAFRG